MAEQAELPLRVACEWKDAGVNSGQKVVTSVALGAGLAVVAAAISSRLNGPVDGGWFMYSPDSTGLHSPPSSHDALLTTLVRLGAIAVWFGVSWRLFRSDR